jgi:hypothetical protein
MKLFILFSFLIVSGLALPPSRESRIWNGRPAVPGQAPYMVGILWFQTDTTVQPMNICGGAIVNVWYVMYFLCAPETRMKCSNRFFKVDNNSSTLLRQQSHRNWKI